MRHKWQRIHVYVEKTVSITTGVVFAVLKITKRTNKTKPLVCYQCPAQRTPYSLEEALIPRATDKAVKEYVRSTPRQNISHAAAGGIQKAGVYRFTPLYACIHRMTHEGKPVTHRYVTLAGVLLHPVTPTHLGTLRWFVPFNASTEASTTALVVGLGWDRKFWPHDEGWPTFGTKEASGFLAIMEDQKLDRLALFPPSETGSPALRINVMSASETFPLPVPNMEAAMESDIDRLKEWVNAP